MLAIAGPTASGKSGLALALSRLLPVTIINADASQVYCDLRILSARPDAAEEAQAPHALFGHIDGSEECSAARWASEAKAAIVGAHAGARLPVLVGGSGLYLRTLLDGIAPIPAIDPAIRAEVRTMTVVQAHAALMHLDPEASARLNPHDVTRIARALEVIRSTGRPLAEWQRTRSGGIDELYRVQGAVLLPPRDWLRARCDDRFDAMLKGGAISEVESLLARDLSPKLPVMRAIGVREISALIRGEIDRETCSERTKAATRQYAKRQSTWFRHQLPPDWHHIESQLGYDNINELAIICRNMSLTS